MRRRLTLLAALALVLARASPATADFSFKFSTGDPDGRIATASRPESKGKIEIESADDFSLFVQTKVERASFTGLLPHGFKESDIKDVRVEIYRVFPKDSDTVRPIRVPTRTNSPSDVAFDDRESAANTLKFNVTVLDKNFKAANSVIDGIHPKPGNLTGGDGKVDGEEVRFDVVFATPFLLPADHYFFIPQVELAGDKDNFLWLSAAHPQFTGDLQSWIRNADLDPDWLRIGTDIVGGTTFNGSFSLLGTLLPAPPGIVLAGTGLIGLLGYGLRRRRA
jgi:hypothetical protein